MGWNGVKREILVLGQFRFVIRWIWIRLSET